MSQSELQQNLSTINGNSSLYSSKNLLKPLEAYQLVEEKDQLLNFLATWKDRDLTDQQAIEQLTTLTANATPATSAKIAHQMQMELLSYANTIVEKIIDSKATPYKHTLKFFDPHQIYS